MSPTWQSAEPPVMPRIGPLGWVLVALRALPLLILVFGGLLVLLALRLIERPVFGLRRPVTPHVTQFVCRNALRIMGIGWRAQGTPLNGPGAVVANHSSWLDIFALNAGKRVYFVSKDEVAAWPGIGWLARATGTVFIRRNPRKAREHVETFRARLAVGHRLLFFPEGTSTDGQRVLPFKPTLFAAFFDDALRESLMIQPVTVVYSTPQGVDPRFYGWWGDMGFGPHLLAVLARSGQGAVTVSYHPPVQVSDYPDRKVLARVLEQAVSTGFAQMGQLVQP